MKKSLAIILSGCLMLFLAACNNESTVSTDADTTSTIAKEDHEVDNENSSTEKDSNDVEKENDGPTGDEFVRGTITGNTYSSDFSGITITKPSDWNFASDDDILMIYHIVDGEKTVEEIIELGSGIDMMATHGMNNMLLVGYENLIATNRLDCTEDEYAEMAKSVMLQNGDTIISSDEITLGGYEYIKCIVVGKDVLGNETNQVYFWRRVDNYMLQITASVSDGNYDIIEAMFEDKKVG